MPRLAIQDQDVTLDEFRTLEANAPRDERWELLGGRIWRMMAGGSIRHNLLVRNIARAFDAAVLAAGQNCLVLTEKIKLERDELGLSAYPDILVACGTLDLGKSAIGDATIVVEVLSRSTELKDRLSKVPLYRRLPAARLLMLVDQQRPWVEYEARDDSGRWLTNDTDDPAGLIPIVPFGAALSLADIYAGALSGP